LAARISCPQLNINHIINPPELVHPSTAHSELGGWFAVTPPSHLHAIVSASGLVLKIAESINTLILANLGYHHLANLVNTSKNRGNWPVTDSVWGAEIFLNLETEWGSYWGKENRKSQKLIKFIL
jgi:hypothetical protein